MKKFSCAVILFSISLSGCASKKRIAFHIAVGVTSVVQFKGGSACRRNNGPEPCTEHYGSINGFAIADGVLTGALIALSESGHKKNLKEWFIPETGIAVFNVWWGIHEARIHSHADKTRN
jgi:hypothetical protein